MKKIIITERQREHLMKVFGVSRQTIWSAVNYKTDNDRARKIRQAAINHGAQVISDNVVRVDGDSVNVTFNNVEMQVEGTNITVYIDGHEECSVSDASIASYEAIKQRYKARTDSVKC